LRSKIHGGKGTQIQQSARTLGRVASLWRRVTILRDAERHPEAGGSRSFQGAVEAVTLHKKRLDVGAPRGASHIHRVPKAEKKQYNADLLEGVARNLNTSKAQTDAARVGRENTHEKEIGKVRRRG